MKKKRQLVWVIAVVTGLVITGFQLFWLRQTFAVSRANFLKTAANDLQKSISNYQLQRNDRLLKRTSADSSLSFFVTGSAHGPLDPGKWKRYKTALSPGNMETMKLLLSGLLSQVANDPVATKTIKAIYKKELSHDGIPIDFAFTVYPGQSRLKPGSVTATLGLSAGSPLLVANFEDSAAYLLELNLPNIAVSIALLLLTTGCLWYMASVIREQARLQQLQAAFISNMTHEFRTPVAVLRSTHEALNQFDGLDDREMTVRYLKANQLVLSKLESDIDRLSTIGPLERSHTPVKLEEVNLRNLLEEVIARYDHQSQALALNYELNENIIFTDRFMLDSIVSNLVDNALKYGGEQVRVTLKTFEKANGWQLDVKDNGPGIAPQYLPYLFDRFYRVPQGDLYDTKGYGLGLSFVKELTGRLQGKVSAASVAGEGSTFSVQFPRTWKK